VIALVVLSRVDQVSHNVHSSCREEAKIVLKVSLLPHLPDHALELEHVVDVCQNASPCLGVAV